MNYKFNYPEKFNAGEILLALCALLILMFILGCKTTEKKFDKATVKYTPEKAVVRLAEKYPEFYEPKSKTDSAKEKIKFEIETKPEKIKHDTIFEDKDINLEYEDADLKLNINNGEITYSFNCKATKQTITKEISIPCPQCPPCPGIKAIKAQQEQYQKEIKKKEEQIKELEKSNSKLNKQVNQFLVIFLIIALIIGGILGIKLKRLITK